MIGDNELLRRYSEDSSEQAFVELVRRHLDFVYSAALRQTRNAQRAEDATQMVFIDLARKAATLARREDLAGWLYTATHYASVMIVRSESRRQAREQKSQLLHEQSLDSTPKIAWNQIDPVLDEALRGLSDRDRGAVLMRFFQNASFVEVGLAFSLSEGAARKRVDRALEQLGQKLKKRGITSTTSALAVVLANQPTVAAPAVLASTVANAALAAAEIGGAGASATFGFLKLMSTTKIAATVGAVVIAAAVTTILDLRTYLNQKTALAAAESSYERSAKSHVSGAADNLTSIRESLVQERLRIQRLKARPKGILDSLMKPAATWTNVGNRQPSAAVESTMAALKTEDYDAFSHLFFLTGDTKIFADKFFASLPPEIQTRYATVERLLAPMLMQALKDSEGYDENLPSAFQVFDEVDHGPDTVIARTWTVLTSGDETEVGMPQFEFDKTPNGWQFPFTIGEAAFESKIIPLLDRTSGNIVMGTRAITK